MAKTAEMRTQQKEVAPKLSNAAMIDEVRKCRKGKLFVGNMEYVDALLQGHDNAHESNKLLKTANEQNTSTINALNQQVANWKGIAEQRATKIATDFETIANLETRIAVLEGDLKTVTEAVGNVSTPNHARSKFTETEEAWISQYMTEHNCTRSNAVKAFRKRQAEV